MGFWPWKESGSANNNVEGQEQGDSICQENAEKDTLARC